METIIGLLFILLPVIFNLIGKKLEKSGKTSGADKMREIAKALGADDDDTVSRWLQDEDEDPEEEPVAVQDSVELEPEPVPVRPSAVEVQPCALRTDVNPEGTRAVPRRTKPVLKTEPDKPKEKIDPKKLVIYSEIMKPKFTE